MLDVVFFVSYQSYESIYQDNEEHASVLFGLGLFNFFGFYTSAYLFVPFPPAF